MGKDRDNVPASEENSAEKVRARLRAAGLFKHLEPPTVKRPAVAKPHDDVVVPFRRRASDAARTGRRRQIAAAVYLLLLATNIVLAWH
jgi:hypothetical protein